MATGELHVYESHDAVAAHFARAAEGDAEHVAMGEVACHYDELVRWLVRSAAPEARIVSKEAKLLLLAAVVEAMEGTAAVSPGRVRSLADAVNTCQRAGLVGGDIIEASTTAKPAPRRRLVRLAEAMHGYDARLRDLGLWDGEQAKWRVAKALAEGAELPPRLRSLAEIHVHGGATLAASDVALLSALAARLPAPTEVVLSVPHREGSPYFRSSARLIERMEAQGTAGAITLRTPDPAAEESAGSRTLRALHATLPETAGFDVMVAGSPEQEAWAVAQRVRSFVEGGTDPSRIAVACRGDGARQRGFVRALAAAGVPVASSPAPVLGHVHLVRWLRSVVALALHGASRDGFAAILGSDYGAVWFRRGRVAANLLRRMSVRPTVTGWRGELLGALAAWRASEGQTAEWTQRVTDTEEAITALADACDALRAAVGVADGVTALRGLITRAGLGEVAQLRGFPAPRLASLIVGGDGELSAMDGEAVGRDAAALAALEELLAAWADAAETTKVGSSWPFATVAAILDDDMGRRGLSLGAMGGAGVRVLDPKDLSPGAVDVLVLAAMEDGVFPRMATTGAWLRPEDEWHVGRALSRPWSVDAHDVGRDVVLSRREAEEPTLFAMAVASADTSLVFSRSTTDATGKNARPSPFMADVFARAAMVEVTTAYGHREAKEAVVRAVAKVAPGISAAAAAREGAPSLPPSDLGVEDVIRRAWQERARTAAMLEPGEAWFGPWSGAGTPAPHIASADRPLSASGVDEAAQCGFKYFADRLLRLRAERPGEDDPDAAEDGSTAHLCFEAAMGALIAEGFVPYDPGRAVAAAARAKEVALAVAERRLSQLPIAAETRAYRAALMASRVSRVVAALYEAGDGYAPVAVEWEFGAGDTPPLVLRDGAGMEAVFRGRVDLVETQGSKVRVSDLKSSARSTLETKMSPDALSETEFQLFLYAAATAASRNASEADARFLSLKNASLVDSIRTRFQNGRGKWKDTGLTPEDLLSAARGDGAPTVAATNVLAVVSSLRRGFFPAAPVEGLCERCDYSALCRIPREASDQEAE